MACGDTCRRSKGKGDPMAAGRAYAQCSGIPVRAIDPVDVTAYAHRAGAVGDDQLCYAMACLLTGRIIYAKRVPGDCPTETTISLGVAGRVAQVSKLSSVGIAATGFLAGPGALIALPLTIWGLFSAHHKIAVAREQATGCDVSQAYNGWEESIEQGITKGTISIADAKAAVPQVEQQLIAALHAIKYEDCNAPCFIERALRALDLYAVEKGYDSLAKPKAGKALELTVLAGAGVFGAHALGAF